MIDKRKTERLVGETIRDIGILVFVFGPLDALFQQPAPGVAVHRRRHTVGREDHP